MKKWIFVITGLILAFVLFFTLFYDRGPKTVVFVHNFKDQQLPALQSVLDSFEKDKTQINIDLRYIETKDLQKEISEKDFQPDIFLWRGPITENFPFSHTQPRRWMSSGWSLGINRALVGEEAVNTLKSAETIGDLEKLFDSIKDEGLTPVSIGNSHLWPLNSWSQHILISLNEMDDNYIPELSDEDYFASWVILQRWQDKGFFLQESWNEGWPRGVNDMAMGKAAVTLLSDKMLTAIPSEKRADLEFIKFPQNPRNPWLIGSGTSIMINEDSDVESEAEELLDFLTKPEVTKYLSVQLQRFFYSQEEEAFSRHIPSWQELSNTPEMREYGTELKAFVEGE